MDGTHSEFFEKKDSGSKGLCYRNTDFIHFLLVALIQQGSWIKIMRTLKSKARPIWSSLPPSGDLIYRVVPYTHCIHCALSLAGSTKLNTLCPRDEKSVSQQLFKTWLDQNKRLKWGHLFWAHKLCMCKLLLTLKCCNKSNHGIISILLFPVHYF